MSDFTNIFGGTTNEIRAAVQTAIRLLGGAQAIELTNGKVQVNFCGRTNEIPSRVYALGKRYARVTRTEFLEPGGYGQPYDWEAMLRAISYIEYRAYMDFTDHRVKVCFIPDAQSGVAFLRCEQPARMLNKYYPTEFFAEVVAELSFASLVNYDVIVLQRGLFLHNYAIIDSVITRLQQAGRKLVYETDDTLQTHLENKTFYHLRPGVEAFIRSVIKRADGIFVTTSRLADLLGYPDKTYVLPNAIDYTSFRPAPRIPREGVHINWSGSASHGPDFRWAGPALERWLVAKKRRLESDLGQPISLSFMGYFPPGMEKYTQLQIMNPTFKEDSRVPRGWVIEGRENIYELGTTQPHEYLQTLVNLEPDISLIPLDPKIVMNGYKSILKFLESTAAGAACVVTDTPPYDVIPTDCALKVRTPEQFVGGMHSLIINKKKRQQYVERASAWVKEHYDWATNVGGYEMALKDLTHKGGSHEPDADSQRLPTET